MATFFAMLDAARPLPIDRLRWFAGDRDALDLYERVVFIAHAWDDLIDRDKPVDVNGLMANLLLYLPANPVYRRFEADLRAIFMTSMVGYLAANRMEQSGDGHKVEIAHFLRYAVANVAVFLIGALNGLDKGAEIVAEAMPVMIPERVADYVKEHLNEEQARTI
jgi:hypothetical protein